MPFLVRKFFVVLALVFVLSLSAYVGYRCGIGEGRRISYRADVSAALQSDPRFKRYVDSLYVATYRSVLDSVVRTDKVVGAMFDWMNGKPGCGMQKKELPISKPSASDFDRVFMKRSR